MSIYEITKLDDNVHVQKKTPNPQIYKLFEMGAELEQVVDSLDPGHGGDYYTKEEVDSKLANKQNTLTFDNTPTDGSANPVTSNGIYDAIEVVDNKLDNKQDKLTFDSKPTNGSSNPVTSDGIYDTLTDFIKEVKVKIIGTTTTPTLQIPANMNVDFDITSVVTASIPSGYKILSDSAIFVSSISHPSKVIYNYAFKYNNVNRISLVNITSESVTLNNVWINLIVVKM